MSESIVRVHCRENCGVSLAFKGEQTLAGYHFGAGQRGWLAKSTTTEPSSFSFVVLLLFFMSRYFVV